MDEYMGGKKPEDEYNKNNRENEKKFNSDNGERIDMGEEYYSELQGMNDPEDFISNEQNMNDSEDYAPDMQNMNSPEDYAPDMQNMNDSEDFAPDMQNMNDSEDYAPDMQNMNDSKDYAPDMQNMNAQENYNSRPQNMNTYGDYNRRPQNGYRPQDNNVPQYAQNTNRPSYGQPMYNQNGYNQQSPRQNTYQPYMQPQQNMMDNGNNRQAPVPENGNEKKPKKKTSGGMKVFIAIIAVIVVLAVILLVAIFSGGDKTDKLTSIENTTSESSEGSKNTSKVEDVSAGDSSVEAGEAAEVAKIAKKYNVGILIYANDSLYTEGSGVIVKEDESHKYTYIVTCAHVVNYSGVAISVLMEDGTEYTAEVVGLDTRTDIAVVRIEASGLPTAEFANSDDLIVGQVVYAVGNPGGSEFFGSLTNGIISAIDRPISSSTGYEMECIQHTAAINPGNSGGALVNGEGKLIGINSMKIASTEYEGMGFAVPSSVVMQVFNSIVENGYVAGRAKLGITYTSPSSYSQTYSMYVQMKGLPSGTIVIASISDDSDLAKKDVKVGDMITKVNGKDMTDTGMLAAMIEDMSVGDTLSLTIVRVNTETWTQTEQTVTISLVEDKGSTKTESTTESSNSAGNSGDNGSSNYQDWYDYFKQQYGY